MNLLYQNMRNFLVNIGLFLAFFIGTGLVVNAQTDCPANLVCITPTAARQALEDGDARKALEAETAGLKQAIEDMRKELNRMRIEFAEKSGENTALKQQAVRADAIIDLLLKSVKPKKIGLIVF